MSVQKPKNSLELLTLVLVCLCSNNIQGAPTGSETWSVGDPRWCQQDGAGTIKRFEVVPGLGWDNLVNTEMAQVIASNFSTCRLTDDGTYLIPDNIFTIPIKSSKLQTFAEIIEDWQTSSSVTSYSINADASFTGYGASISGEYSQEHQEMKSKMIEDDSSTIRMQLRYDRYKVKIQPGALLSDGFKTRLMNIAASLEVNNTDQAQYDSQLLVRDFGTHVLTTVTAGAGLVKDDFVKRSYLEDHAEEKTSILASASASFQSSFAISGDASVGYDTNTSNASGYSSEVTYSYTETHGGRLFLAGGMTAREWAEDLDSNLVAMDKSGDPLYLLITAENLPEIPGTTLGMLEREVQSAIELYYTMNVIPGCTELSSPKFSVSANFDDGSCDADAEYGLTLGGIFQTCTTSGTVIESDPCDGMIQKNVLTGDLSCPDGYTAALLYADSFTNEAEYLKTCESCYWLFTCCTTDQYIASANYAAYWCAGKTDVLEEPAGNTVEPEPLATAVATVEENGTTAGLTEVVEAAPNEDITDEQGYLFGGVYSSTSNNLVTDEQDCPSGFYHRDILTDLKVCVSDDVEMSSLQAVPFGGFFSCAYGNPLAVTNADLDSSGNVDGILESFVEEELSSSDSWPKKCPQGYSQHLGTIEGSCAIYFCVESGKLSGPSLPKVQRPPFMDAPIVEQQSKDAVVAVNEQTFVWYYDMRAVEEMSIASKQTSSSATISSGTVAAIVLSIIVGILSIVVLLLLVDRRRRQPVSIPPPDCPRDDASTAEAGVSNAGYKRSNDEAEEEIEELELEDSSIYNNTP